MIKEGEYVSIADKIKNIYLEKKNLKRVLKDAGSDIDENTLFADYPNKIDEVFLKDNFYTKEELEFIVMYYSCRQRNNAWKGSTLDIIDLTQFPFNNQDFIYYFESSTAQRIILPQQDYNISNFCGTFKNCNNLKEIENINRFYTRTCTSLKSCFDGCSSLEYLDLSHWETRNVETVSYIFRDCINLKYLDIRNFDYIKVLESSLNYPDIFSGVKKLETLRMDNCSVDTVLGVVYSLYNDNYFTGLVSPCTIYCSQEAVDAILPYNQPFTFVAV